MTDEIKKLDNIGDILSSIQANLKVSKEKTNAFGKYKYRNAEDILHAVKDELKKEIYPACCIITNIDPASIADRFFIKCNAVLNFGDKWMSADGYAELEENKKGMDLAQLTGAATSYAKKYALGNLFAIDDSKDDPDSKDNTQSGKSNKPAPGQVDKTMDELVEEKKLDNAKKKGAAVGFAESIKEDITNAGSADEIESFFEGNKKIDILKANYKSVYNDLIKHKDDTILVMSGNE
jgi:hypothetical protein